MTNHGDQYRRKSIQQTTAAGLLIASPLWVFSQAEGTRTMSANIKSRGLAARTQIQLIKAEQINDAWEIFSLNKRVTGM